MFRGRVICGLLMVSYLFKPYYANIVPKMQDKLYRLKMSSRWFVSPTNNLKIQICCVIFEVGIPTKQQFELWH